MSFTRLILLVVMLLGIFCSPKKNTTEQNSDANNLGLPMLEIPANNPNTPEKIALGNKLFHDSRFSSTGKISCATCHAGDKGFTDNLKVSKGINDLTGTRNAPTVLNAAFLKAQFWDGRSPDLEDQAQHPFLNPVEMGLKDHEPILKIVREDASYNEAFKKIFDVSGSAITIKHVTMAIAAFERTLVGGNSRFDRWYFRGEQVLSDKEKSGFETFVGKGRCVSCHVVEYTSALFSDNSFHNIGVGINKLSMDDIKRLSEEFLNAKYKETDVDLKVLQDAKTSELGRFAVTRNISEVGAFKTSTLRNIELTAPYMHDGSLKTLEEVVEHYNRGGASSDSEKITPYLDGGIRPLELTSEEKANLVAFMKTLTSEQFKK